ncbi:GTP-binding protein GEM-like isoform X1 [Eriocheir sinensis]|uniref:GTP-binding protein GEM-like isoform X1 n=1 Tax=Eriocheir sinensis TaxID=95602 RepID=UPI0021C619D4|nr:GTP-binding protein GEM-like isoform X1 [Eriocheir sinensis]
MSRLASIRLTSTESDSTSLSGCPNSSTSQEYVDSDMTMSPLSPKSPVSPRSPRGSRPCSPLASPVRARGGNLAYLASRRSSRDSEAGDVAPLNYARYKHRRTSNFLELPTPDHFRPRVSSLPEKPYNPRDAEEIYRLRSFSITSKGIINRGDSIISKRSRSNTSVCSTTSRRSSLTVSRGSVSEEARRQSVGQEAPEPARPSPRLSASNLSVHTLTSRPSSRSGRSGERSPFEGSCCGSSYVSSESSIEVAKYRVVLLGESGVGKSSLVNQFMTSEYINTYDASLDDEFGEKSVSVLLDGEESEVIFIDHPAHEMSVENCLSTYDPHACIIVYSITDKGSFKKAEDIITYLWRENYPSDKAVILVGNKVDLARSRVVSMAEGKSLARSHDGKFIETSSGLQHNVDELLVGVVKQVRLRLAAQRKRLKRVSTSKTSLSLHAAKDLLNKMCLLDSKSKSCENLHVL